MNANWKNRVPLAVAAALLGALLVVIWRQPVLGQRDGGSAAAPRYSVIDTEGHNLIVTDNQKNTLYFYTIDKDKPIGSDLKLRGSLDLNQVGKPVIRPKVGKRGDSPERKKERSE
jgi:hypothetical protein